MNTSKVCFLFYTISYTRRSNSDVITLILYYVYNMVRYPKYKISAEVKLAIVFAKNCHRYYYIPHRNDLNRNIKFDGEVGIHTYTHAHIQSESSLNLCRIFSKKWATIRRFCLYKTARHVAAKNKSPGCK